MVSAGFRWFQVAPRFGKYEKKDVVVIFILQKMKNSDLFNTENSNLFDKKYTQENVKYHIEHEESWLRWIVIEQVYYK